MAKSATATISVVLTGDGNTLNLAETPTQNTNAAPPGSVTLANGFTAITIPSGYTIQGVVIVPPANSVVTKTLKGVTGDTGVVLQTAQASAIPVQSSSSIGITANAAEVCQLIWY